MNFRFLPIALVAIAAVSAAGCAMGSMDARSDTAASASMAGDNPMVGGAAMYRTRRHHRERGELADHTTLVAAVKAAGLVDTLNGPGPFTVFAPTNAAFAKLPAGTVDTLLQARKQGHAHHRADLPRGAGPHRRRRRSRAASAPVAVPPR